MFLNKNVLACSLVTGLLLFTGCSSSTSSSSGTGAIPTGIYVGVFNGQALAGNIAVATSDRAQLSITSNTTGSTAGGSTTTSLSVTGTLAITGGNRCFTGGTVTGSVNGNQMTLTITDGSTAVITLTGRTTPKSYNGTFSAGSSKCGAISGGFEFDRT